jgi:hypothetical protein
VFEDFEPREALQFIAHMVDTRTKVLRKRILLLKGSVKPSKRKLTFLKLSSGDGTRSMSRDDITMIKATANTRNQFLGLSDDCFNHWICRFSLRKAGERRVHCDEAVEDGLNRGFVMV